MVHDVLSPIFENNEDINGKLLDAAIEKDKIIKNNLPTLLVLCTMTIYHKW